MDEWIDLGFADFTKNDYYTVIRSFEKFDKDDYQSISKSIGKDLEIT